MRVEERCDEVGDSEKVQCSLIYLLRAITCANPVTATLPQPRTPQSQKQNPGPLQIAGIFPSRRRPCRCEELSGGNSMSLSISRHQVFLNQKEAVQVPMRLRLASAWVD
jgi:hypothetical protein